MEIESQEALRAKIKNMTDEQLADELQKLGETQHGQNLQKLHEQRTEAAENVMRARRRHEISQARLAEQVAAMNQAKKRMLQVQIADRKGIRSEAEKIELQKQLVDVENKIKRSHDASPSAGEARATKLS